MSLWRKGHGLPPDAHGGRGLGLGVEALLAELLRLQGDDRRRLDRPPGDAAEVALEERLHLRRLEVAGEDAGDVVGGVVGGEVLLRLGERVHRDVRGPAHHRPLVGARLPEERLEGLVVLAERGRLGARAGAPRRRRPAPSRTRGRRARGGGRTRATPTAPAGCSACARSRAVWSSVVHGVQELAAVLGVDLVHLVLHDRLALLLDERVELLVELAVALGPALRAPAGRRSRPGEDAPASPPSPRASPRGPSPAPR